MKKQGFIVDQLIQNKNQRELSFSGHSRNLVHETEHLDLDLSIYLAMQTRTNESNRAEYISRCPHDYYIIVYNKAEPETDDIEARSLSIPRNLNITASSRARILNLIQNRLGFNSQ